MSTMPSCCACVAERPEEAGAGDLLQETFVAAWRTCDIASAAARRVLVRELHQPLRDPMLGRPCSPGTHDVRELERPVDGQRGLTQPRRHVLAHVARGEHDPLDDGVRIDRAIVLVEGCFRR
ncbi:hypothetical protein [Georgenia halophila]|uniref:hypothetical protein n=1 Tax=Georgenia halophila TaxID=620889 RepID=UPI0031E98306